MNTAGKIAIEDVKRAAAAQYPAAPAFTAYDEDDDRPCAIVVYIYGQKGGEAQVSHGWITAAQPFIRAFFTSTLASGLIEGAKFSETLAELVANGHSFSVETRRVRTTGMTPSAAPIEVEAAWHT